jgi:hypothetical protein
VLVFHLRHEAGGLEDALAEFERRRVGRGIARCASLVLQSGFDVFDQPVVLGVEHLVDRGQRDVLVAATVTADEVDVEQFVVVLAVRTVVEAAAGSVFASGVFGRGVDRAGRVRNVVQERGADAQAPAG